jgi:hypothetical protein
MKNHTVITWAQLGAIVLAAGISLTACRPEKPEPIFEEGIITADERRVQDESDQAITDAVNLIESGSAAMGNGRTTGVSICGASIDSLPATKTYVLTFDGTTPCVNGTRTRSGIIRVQLTQGNRWRDPNAVLRVSFENYRVTRLSDGKSLVLNGSKQHLNVSGGRLSDVSTGPIIRRTTGSLELTFDDGTTRTWQIARQHEWRLQPPGLTYRVSGFGQANGYSNLVAWGMNRNNITFFTSIADPIVFTPACGLGRPVSGRKTYARTTSREITATFGVNADGTPATGTDCPYGYRLNWQKLNGETGSAVIAY